MSRLTDFHRLLVGCTLLFLGWLAPADAFANASATRCVGVYCELILSGNRGHFPLNVVADSASIVRFPQKIKKLHTPQKGRFELREYEDFLLIEPRKEAQVNDIVGIDIETDSMHVTLMLRVVPAVEGAARFASVLETSAIEAGLEAHAKDKIAALEMFEYQRRATAALSSQLIVPADGKQRNQASNGVELMIESGWWWDSEELMVIFAINNAGTEPYPLSEFQVTDRRGDQVPPLFMHIERFTGSDKTLAEIPPGQKTRGVVFLRREVEKQFESIQITLKTAQAAQAVWAAVDEWKFPLVVVPKTQEEIEFERREKEWRLRVEDAEGRVNLTPIISIGGLWVPDDNMQPTDTAVAFMSGVGARLTYGIHPMLAVDGEAGYAGTGQAEFDSYKRSDRLGRLQFGPVFRIGSTAQVLLRAGLGVMVLSSTAEAVGGAEAPDLGWSLAGYAYGSIGVERRWDWLVIGAGAGYTAAQKSISAIEAGAHIGISFKP